MRGPLSLGAAGGVVLAAAILLAGCSGAPAPSEGSGATAQGSKAAGSPSEAGRPGTWRPAKPDTLGPVVAVFGNRRLTRHDVDSVIATAPLDVQPRLRTFDGYRQLVERLIFEETLLHLAELDKIEADPEFKLEVAKAVRGAKMRTYYNRRVAALPNVSDSLVQAYYDSHLDDYKIPARVRVRHIQLATQSQAKSVRRKLVNGGLWDEICKSTSQDKTSKDRGGLIGYITKETDLVPGVGSSPAIVAAAFSLKEGETSQPLKGPKGWHLIRVDNLEGASVQPFDQVKARIRQDLDGKAVEAFSTALNDSLKSISNSAIFDDSISVALSPSRTPLDFLKEAQAAVTAQDRVKLYKQVAERFPTDSVSVQARFMIGFTLAEDIGDYEAAREAFEDFLQRYPKAELANSARWMLDNMEKPPPPLQEDAAPSDSTKAPSGTGGGSKPDQARRSP
ncbi:MAG TPA: peptidyl-prolyl cis-trans isomerase [Candidatus Eisenbacteria bacterium]|nr:peptidyl-prolyl cis-trans isomerase [Candidatus Eisenbacteria bacterium]